MNTSKAPKTVRSYAGSNAPSLDPMLSAAWLYYEDQLTQSDIAEVLGVSRASVINYLHEARRLGVVKITLDSEHFSAMRLSQQLAKRFGLARCIVIPDDQGRRPVAERLGEAGAQLLGKLVTAGDVLGVSWGQTVLALSKAIAPQRVAGLSVIQITGSMLSTFEFSPELCTSNIADRFGARCINLHAPALVSRPEIRALLYKEPALIPQLELLQTCTKIVFGVGHLQQDSTIFGSGTVTPADLQPYVTQGAVGVIAGRYIDSAGQPVLGPLDERMIGLTLPEIDRIPMRICLAGGASKATAIRAALDGQHATILITDELAARALVEGVDEV
ncbi:sugar-binding transcriptional regulator [Rhodoferax sp. U2-2l]|uniref:sugar-binding transcriptional regulator n=1 Tax=Rhodoferax sp. U2-2l TaxID=2884000 RepID=UPI001D0A4955|nr:sugar-binding transcriptional regulator [Rhodoferax sp. U2-2l]MCB8746382.1 sugar-binding transcriptional regulator [Rhodoferax sp. U2-2l]